MKTQTDRMQKVNATNIAAFGRSVVLHIGNINITDIRGLFSVGYNEERIHGTGNTGRHPINQEDYTLQLQTNDVMQCKLSKGHEVTIEDERYRIINAPRPNKLGLSEMSIRAI